MVTSDGNSHPHPYCWLVIYRRTNLNQSQPLLLSIPKFQNQFYHENMANPATTMVHTNHLVLCWSTQSKCQMDPNGESGVKYWTTMWPKHAKNTPNLQLRIWCRIPGVKFLSAFFNPVVWLVTSSVPSSLQHCSLHHEPPDAPRRCESRCKMTWNNSLANNNATLVTTCGKKLRQTLTTIHMWAITHILCHTL